MTPVEIHRIVEQAFNAGDIDALTELYEEDAVMVAADGSESRGLPAIRDRWASKVKLGGTMRLRTRYAVQLGDLALLRTDWVFTGAGVDTSACTTEIARLQPDGTWRYVIDHPYGADPDVR